MADLRIKRIKLRNWETVAAAELEFPAQGLVLVMGSNLAAEGKLQSVGAGKTALGEALSRALVGIRGRFSEAGHYYSDNGKDGCYVKIEGELQDQPLTVEMGFKCQELSKTGEGLRFQHGDRKIQHGHVDLTRVELSKTLSVTPELAEWTVFLDGDKLRFHKLSQEDAVSLLMTALAQPPWTQYQEAALKKLQAGNNQLAQSKNTLDHGKQQIEQFTKQLQLAKSDLKEAKEDYQRQIDGRDRKISKIKQDIGANKSAITAAEEEIKKIAKQRKLLEDQGSEAAHKLEIESLALRDKGAEIRLRWNEAVDLRAEKKTALSQAKRTLAEMEEVPTVCPKCNKPWDKAHSEAELIKAKAAVDSAQKAFNRANAACDNIDDELRDLNDKASEINQKIKAAGHVEDIRYLGDQHTKHERLIRNLTAANHEHELAIKDLNQEVDKSFVDKIEATISERQRRLDETKLVVDAAAETVAQDEEVVKVLNYWHKAFSPTGIPNMILADTIPALNNVARRISALMTGSTINVTYSTTKLLAKGGERPKLNIAVENKLGSKRVEGSSKGEGGLTNLIIAENLSEVGQVSKRIGFRWYDEITNGQDPVVRRSIFAYLKEIAHRLGILIFVVDHHVEVASYADYILVAEKTLEGGTRYFFK